MKTFNTYDLERLAKDDVQLYEALILCTAHYHLMNLVSAIEAFSDAYDKEYKYCHSFYDLFDKWYQEHAIAFKSILKHASDAGVKNGHAGITSYYLDDKMLGKIKFYLESIPKALSRVDRYRTNMNNAWYYRKKGQTIK